MTANAIPGVKGFARIPFAERFESRVIRGPSCWEWAGGKTAKGYGQIWRDGRAVYAHRVSYELAHGPIPVGMELDHLCRNPGCVNPAHLEAVTHQENMDRAPKHQFSDHNRRKTHCPKGHPYDEANTYRTAKGRACRVCRNESAKRSHARCGEVE